MHKLRPTWSSFVKLFINTDWCHKFQRKMTKSVWYPQFLQAAVAKRSNSLRRPDIQKHHHVAIFDKSHHRLWLANAHTLITQGKKSTLLVFYLFCDATTLFKTLHSKMSSQNCHLSVAVAVVLRSIQSRVSSPLKSSMWFDNNERSAVRRSHGRRLLPGDEYWPLRRSVVLPPRYLF